MKIVVALVADSGKIALLKQNNYGVRKMTDKLNTREKLAAVAEWLGWQEEELSYGLRTTEDAIKLYDYWQANPDLPEMADEDYDDEDEEIFKHRIAALGYDPMYDTNPNN